MEAIKCLLLLAAVLSFAMNVTAMDDFDLGPEFQQLLAEIEENAENSQNDPRTYLVLEGEDGETCWSTSHMDYMHCMLCCLAMSYEKQKTEAWQPKREVYENYKGRCVCIPDPEEPAPTLEEYQEAKKGLDGVVLNDRRENRNNRNQK
jgi:hypothetical protein